MATTPDNDSPIIPQGITLRAFDDTKAAREGIYAGTLEALKTRFPLENKTYRLELSNVRYTGPQTFTLAQQKHALLSDQNLHTPVSGHFKLIRKADNAVVDEKDEVVMNVPYYTDRGTVINNGSEYTIANQLRLRPGVYTRVRRSGDVETQFNVKPGTGRGFRLRMEPATGVVTVNVGHANMPLYPLLKTLGVSDQEMIKAWGVDVAHANAVKADSASGRTAVDKLYQAFAGYNATAQDLVSKETYLKETLPKFVLDPGVTSRTLGIAAEGITPQVLLRAAAKMFNVNRGEEKADDRDNPGFANVFGIDDLYRERIEKDAGKLSRTLMMKISRAGSLKPVQRGAFSGWHDELLQGSGLAMPGDNSNPMALEEQMMRVTRMGEGGVGSEDVITDEARQVNAGNLNYIDMLAGPENCMPAEAEVMTDKGWMRWDSTTADTVFACLIDGKLKYCRAEERHVYDFDGLLYCGKSRALEYRYTPNHRMWCAPLNAGSRFRFEFAKDVHTACGRILMSGGHAPADGRYTEFFSLPDVPNNGNAFKSIPPIPMRDWAAFMGWYLTEGSTRYVPNKVFHIHIAQQKTACIPVLDRIIRAMPFKMYAVYKTVDGKKKQYGYSGSSRQLCEYLRSFGLSYDKYIPDYLLEADLDTRKALFSSILLGDGRHKRDTFTFCTASRRFADTFTRLAFSLGYTTHLRFEKDARPISTTGGMWCVHILKKDRHQIINSRIRKQTFTEYYCGKVYCATVPGGLLYCRYGDGIGYWTGNSKIGVDARLGVHTRKGSDGKLYSLFLNRQGKKEYVACDTAADSVIGFPNPDPQATHVPAMKDGRVQMVPRDEIDYLMPDTAGLFSSNVNLNPMPTSVQGGRQFYGAKFWSQYLPASVGEAPLVDSLMPDGKATWSEHYGRKLGTLRAPVDGTVTKVTDKGVTVTDTEGKKHFVETVVDFPFNGLTGLTYTPTVKVGDKVAADDMVAASNFVDKKTGGLAMGVNLKMAWLPYKGFSVEDAICISESAAKKLATDRLYGFEADPRDGAELGLAKYMSSFPQKFTKEQYATLDDNGVVKEGTVLNKGDPISVAVGPKLLTAEDANLGKLSKVLRGAFTDKAEVWEHDFPGTVVSSTVFRGRAKVNVKAAPPISVGDKMSPRMALKGVVGRVIPDDQMPRDAATNEPYDILMNPLGIPSRVAPNQLIETALGKLAKATGTPMRIPQDPPQEGWASWASNQLKAAGVSPTADVFDPETGKTLKGIGDGYVYFHAMHHLADKKISAKGGSGSFTSDLQPAKGGYEGAKRVSGLDAYAMLAHGATENLKDALTVRGTKNEDYWKAVRSGGPLPAPQVPFIYQKTMNLLRAGGINVVEGQTATDILPMTDADTEKMTGGRIIQNAKMLDADLTEQKGGLFDPYLTGGNGNRDRWAAIALPEPVPNPVMEEPVRRLLGLTGKRLQAIISGEEQLGGLTGGKALQAALGKIDIDAEIARQRELVRKSRGSARDNAVKVIGYLAGCQKQGLTPKDWMITKVPVIPPMFRPIAKIGDTALISDLNELYRDVVESADAFTQLKADVPDAGLTDERLNVYKAVKAAYGLGEAISPEGQAKRLKGAIRQVIGTSPKFGTFQAKVISKAVGGVGRAVITPEPNYDMDQCGIPDDEAWKLYKDYVIRGLRRRGYPEERAVALVDDRAPVAKDMLVEEMGRRPVILDRAPTWHKFNFMAFWPSLVKGDTMRMNPLVLKGFTADFDGNCIIGSSELLIRIRTTRRVSLEILYYGLRRKSIKFMGDAEKKKWYTSPAMKIVSTAKTVLRDSKGIVAVVCIKDIPHLTETLRKDHKGADVYDVPTGFEVLTTAPDGRGVRWSPFDTLTIENGCSLRHVVTARGREVTVSDNESMAVYDNENGLLKVKPDDVGTRLVPVALGLPAQKTSDLTFRHGWLVGLFLSDGWLSNGRMFITKQSQAVRSRVLRYLADLSGSTDLEKIACVQQALHEAETNCGIGGESIKLSVPTDRIPARLLSLFRACYEADWAERKSTNADRACLHKQVPTEFLTAPEDVKLGLLCGLLDGDGTLCVINRKTRGQVHAAYCTSSPLMRETVTLLLAGLGIPSSTSVTHCGANRAQTHDSFIISIGSNGLAKYASRLDLAEPKTLEIKMLGELRNSQTDLVPASFAVLDLATKHFSADSGLSRGALFSRKSEANKTQWKYTALARTTAAAIVAMLEKDDLDAVGRKEVSRLARLVKDTTTQWERLKTVEPAPTETVYDIAVPETKVFALANGLVIYDTMNFHVPASEKAVDEAKEKMLPSKNLFSTTDLRSPRFVPMMEMTLGLAKLTAPASTEKPKVFVTTQDAIRAYRRGEIGANDPVSILRA